MGKRLKNQLDKLSDLITNLNSNVTSEPITPHIDN